MSANKRTVVITGDPRGLGRAIGHKLAPTADVFLADHSGLPEVDDTVAVEGRTIRVLELDGRRIARLLVDPPVEPEPETAGNGERAAD
jgi:NAD(P)-dependent dehydrogenase (short-subunit alcohol dehydrogenase family)